MKISVIIPLFNGAEYIHTLYNMIKTNIEKYDACHNECIDAEIVFVNDQPGERILLLHLDEIPCKFVNHTVNKGIHSSRIDGLNASTGDFVLFLDQDDSISDDYISTQLDCLFGNGSDWVICNGIYRISRTIYQHETDVRNLLSTKHYFQSITEIISPGQVVLKRDRIPEEWCENVLKYNYCDDAFLWILLKNNHSRLAYNDNIAYFHHENNNNTSFCWGGNAAALRELKDVINSKCMIDDEYLMIFNETVDKEIEKQEVYSVLEEKYLMILNTDVRNELVDILGKDTIIIWGYGVWGRRLHDLLSFNGISVIDVCDNNICDNVEGVYVQKPNEVLAKNKELDDMVVIITSPMDKEAIQKQIYEHGPIRTMSIIDLFDRLLEENK